MPETLSVLPLAAGSLWEKVAFIVAILLIAYVVTLWISTVMWTYRDIQARTSDRSVHAICTLLVAVFNIPGLALYLMLRPQQTLSDRFDRQLVASMRRSWLVRTAARRCAPLVRNAVRRSSILG